MNYSSRLLLGILSAAVVTAMVLPARAALEPWSEIEARTKFLRTKHYIEVVRVHSDVYKSARSKQGEVPGPFPVHVILPDDYETNVNRRYGVVYLLGGKSGWDNGPELGGATYWSVWCKTPLTMDNLKSGNLAKVDFQDNITEEELGMFNQWLKDDPYEDVIVVSLWNPGGGDTSRYEKYLIGEVIPFIDAHYRTVPNRYFRGIDGACAGAAQAIMISARHPDVFAYAGGQQTDLGSYPGTHGVWRANLSKIHKAGGIAYNINTNVRDGCNSYSNRGRLYQLVEDMRSQGFPVEVHIFKSCPHGYCAYRYPNGHQALYWFSRQFKRNLVSAGMNQDVREHRASESSDENESTSESQEPSAVSQSAQYNLGPLPGLW
ncbi:MAG: alpha/beta hydrolase-fold protein [Desulfomonilaceae bacterium]|nr:alpha/beta hydrolase-fold protein [Desulfomonilaceae bacterium]